MSWMPDAEPASRPDVRPAIDLRIDARTRDLGGFTVRRVLPAVARRMVGPFIFWDHMGPAQFAPGQGIDVRPHPHLHLATITYLFEGEILHRDNLGSRQPIRPGDVNWMHAGRGIVHSERTDEALRAKGSRLHGIQAWVALPRAAEDTDPAFFHHDRGLLPVVDRGGARVVVIAGEAFGARSPVHTASPLLYADVSFSPGASLEVPAEHEERAVYVAEGEVEIDGERFGEGAMAVLTRGAPASLHAGRAARALVLGGAPLDGPRFIEWNFVSSSQAAIEKAKADWRAGRFVRIPGDDQEFIPLP